MLRFDRVEGDLLRRVAAYGSMASPDDRPLYVNHGSVLGERAIIDRQTIHVHDIDSWSSILNFREPGHLTERTGVRTILGTPLLREGDPIGAIVIHRTEVRPFTDNQISAT